MSANAAITVVLVICTVTQLAGADLGNPIGNVTCSAKAATVEISKQSFLWSYAGGNGSLTYPNILARLVNGNCSFSINYIENKNTLTISVDTCEIKTYTTFGGNGPTNYFYSFDILANAAMFNTNGDFVIDPSKPRNFTLSISCQFGAQGSISDNAGNVQGTDGGDTGGGGDSEGVAGKVRLNFTLPNGAPLPTTIYAGDDLAITLALFDETYAALLPLSCKFSADEAGHIGFSVIQDGCPQENVVMNNDDIYSIDRIDLRSYQTRIKAFTLVQQKQSDLWYSCHLRLCINESLCDLDCWGNDTQRDAGLVLNLAQEESHGIRYLSVVGRLGAERSDPNKDVEGTVKKALVIYERPGYTSLPTWLVVVIILVAVLAIFGVVIGLVCCLCCGAGAGWLWRKQKNDQQESYVPDGPNVIVPVEYPQNTYCTQ